MNSKPAKNPPTASSYKKNNPNTKKRLAAVIFIIATLSTVIATGCKTCECPAYSQKNEKTKIKIINNELFQTETSKNIILHCEHMQNEHDQNSLLNYQKYLFTNFKSISNKKNC